MRRSSRRNREFEKFNDPIVKLFLGIGIALTLLFFVATLLEPLIGAEKFLVMLKTITWALGAYSIFGAMLGLTRGIRYANARERRNV